MRLINYHVTIDFYTTSKDKEAFNELSKAFPWIYTPSFTRLDSDLFINKSRSGVL